MGLDMYLSAKRYLWNVGDHPDKQVSSAVQALFPKLKDHDRWGSSESRIKEVIAEAIYWRKANAIHKWFVDNVQDGNDDCGSYYVSRDKLEELRQLIIEALDKKDASKLPPQAGFFFGNTNVDEWYWDDLRRTEAEITQVMDMFDENWEFEYSSSW